MPMMDLRHVMVFMFHRTVIVRMGMGLSDRLFLDVSMIVMAIVVRVGMLVKCRLM